MQNVDNRLVISMAYTFVYIYVHAYKKNLNNSLYLVKNYTFTFYSISKFEVVVMRNCKGG